MDCDTTGVEPDFALVKFKKLAGGGYFKIANQSLRPALVNLGYTRRADSRHHEVCDGHAHAARCAAHQLRKPQARRASPTKNSKDRSTPCPACSSSPSHSARGRSAPSCFAAAGDPRKPSGKRRASTCCTSSASRKRQIDDANDVICGRGHRRRRAAPQSRAPRRLRLRQQVRQARQAFHRTSKATSA